MHDLRYVDYGRLLASSSSCCAIVLRIEPTEEEALLALRRPKAKPAPRPISKASTPMTMGTQSAMPPEELFVVDVVPWLVVVARGVGVVAAAGCTVKTKAPWSGSPSSAETVFHCTTYTPFRLAVSGLMEMDISLGLVRDTFALPWLIRSPAGL